jgi:hypothetical protein
MYKLTAQGDYAQLVGTNEYHNTSSNPEYLAWLAAGNTPEPYVPPPPAVPTTVTRFQALAVLAAGGYLPTIRTYIATLDQNNVQRLAWENATDWERTSPTVNAIAAMLGLSDAQVDDLFIAAAQVSA